jgi:acetyltransferase-like isoleucine patch superfamily enzyme
MQLNLKRWFKQHLAEIFRRIRVMENSMKNEALTKKGILQIGRHTYGNPIIHNYKGSESLVKIGSFCSISPDVVFITGGIHPTEWVSLYPFRAHFNLAGKFSDGMPTTHGDIIVGNDVWIGTGAMIMSGVHIGDGAVIAARSVVTRNVQAYTISAGAPATTMRKRFTDYQIEALLSIRWWDWDDERIIDAIPLLSTANIRTFIDHAARS